MTSITLPYRPPFCLEAVSPPPTVAARTDKVELDLCLTSTPPPTPSLPPSPKATSKKGGGRGRGRGGAPSSNHHSKSSSCCTVLHCKQFSIYEFQKEIETSPLPKATSKKGGGGGGGGGGGATSSNHQSKSSCCTTVHCKQFSIYVFQKRLSQASLLIFTKSFKTEL